MLFGNISAYKGILEFIEGMIGYLNRKNWGDVIHIIIAGPVKKGQSGYHKRIKTTISASPEYFSYLPYFFPEDEYPYLLSASDYCLFNYKSIHTSGGLMMALSYHRKVIAPNIGIFSSQRDHSDVQLFNDEDELHQIINQYGIVTLSRDMSSISQKLASLAFGDLVTRGLGFVSSMVLARALGPESYGIWTTALAIFSYLLWFSDLGIMQLGTREVATEGQRRLYSTAELFLGKLIWAICAMIILFLFAPFLPYSEEINTLVWLLLFSLIPYALHTEWIFSGKQEFLTLQSIKAAQATVFFALILYGIQRADDLEKLPMYYGLSVGLASLLLWTVSMYKRYLVISPSALTLDLIERIYSILKESLQLGIGWVGSQIIILFPPLIFALFYSDAFVGWYGAALRIIMLYMVLDRIFVQLLLPNLANGWDKEISANSISTRLEQAYRYHTLLGLLGSFCGTIFSTYHYSADLWGSIHRKYIHASNTLPSVVLNISK